MVGLDVLIHNAGLNRRGAPIQGDPRLSGGLSLTVLGEEWVRSRAEVGTSLTIETGPRTGDRGIQRMNAAQETKETRRKLKRTQVREVKIKPLRETHQTTKGEEIQKSIDSHRRPSMAIQMVVGTWQAASISEEIRDLPSKEPHR